MTLDLITEKDRAFVMSLDRHINEEQYRKRVLTESGYVLKHEGKNIGTMFHTVLWDNLPFLNFLYLKEEFRGKGFGTQAMLFWEQEMKNQGYDMTLLSTQADETAQYFYRKLGYLDCGVLLFQNTPLDQPAELFFRKVL